MIDKREGYTGLTISLTNHEGLTVSIDWQLAADRIVAGLRKPDEEREASVYEYARAHTILDAIFREEGGPFGF